MYPNPHDLGGSVPALDEEDNGWAKDRNLYYWEKRTHALLVLLARRALITTDELRRAVEGLEKDSYDSWGYYDRWCSAMATILLERGVISNDEIAAELGEAEHPQGGEGFKAGDLVRVKSEDERLRWRKPHLRTPGYVFGCVGVVDREIGEFSDPFLLAFRGGQAGPKTRLYSVAFKQRDLFSHCPDGEEEGADDEVTVEIYERWLLPAKERPVSATLVLGKHDQDHHHHHDHEHEHEHQGRFEVELRAVQAEPPPSPGQVVGDCLVRILCAKGLVSTEELNSTVTALETLGTELLGARLVAKAWVDDEFKRLLLHDAGEAGRSMGINTSNPNAPTVLVVVENTPRVWNLVVCTLCSCYPSSLLGIAPSWYKSSTYRRRAVVEPRKALAAFGTIVGPDAVVKVHDSTADTRYMVLPERPEGTQGWSEQELFDIITRDALVGVARVGVPQTSN